MNSDGQLMTSYRAAYDLDHTPGAVLKCLALLSAQASRLTKGWHPQAVHIQPEERGIKVGNKKPELGGARCFSLLVIISDVVTA
ncbi:hypothetical protein [Synechococcus sp. MIT S9503]|uniref:hypothetical protein n=1 Tax=Synechococcus sp. MIT S9503 TaxID=3082547 RepID=UPI0039A41F1D